MFAVWWLKRVSWSTGEESAARGPGRNAGGWLERQNGEQITSICRADLEIPDAAPTWNLFDWMQMSFVRCEEPVNWIMNESAPPKVARSKETSLSDRLSTACIMNHLKPVRGNAMCDLLSVLSVHLYPCRCNYFLFSFGLLTPIPPARSLWLTGSGFFAFLSFPCWTF